MKKTPERIEKLAAEYVLGSLQGLARKRFERWMMESAAVRQEVWFWEQKLGPLSDEVAEVNPPSSVWNSIERRLWQQERHTGKAQSRANQRWFWPGWSIIATAAALVMAVLLVQPSSEAPQMQLSGAIVQAGIGDPLWLVSETGRNNLLKLRSVAANAAEADKDYELWIVPEDGQPLSLGVIAVGGVHQVTLTDTARQALSQSRTLAISLEPLGGSPTGAPTGPILHVAQLYEI
ncbi:MAG: anti-sigma factor [Marinobacter sp.]